MSDESVKHGYGSMKRRNLDIKKLIKKRIENRLKGQVFLEKGSGVVKKNANMGENERNRLRMQPGAGKPKVNVQSISHAERDAYRRGILPQALSQTSQKKVNIIISAYDCVEFIEECLNSIQTQTYKNWRILLGIDGCEKTLQKVKEIRYKYSNLEVFYAEKNEGPYVMFNSLMNLVSDNEYVQIFGADDRMNPNMLENMSRYETPAVSYNDGVLFVKKEVMKKVGGFRDWRCAADSDMLFRIKLAVNESIRIAPQYFFRREHDKQLTKSSGTNFSSVLRKSYVKIYESNKRSKNPDVYIEPVLNHIERVKYNIFTAIPVNGRHELLPHTIKRLLTKCGVSKVYCMGDDDNDKKICEKAGAEWVDHPNFPLGSKWNSGIEAALKSGVVYDGFLFVGSSDWVSENWIDTFSQYLSEYDMVGTTNCYFLDINTNSKKRLVHWGGYSNDRKGEAIGIGRIYSMRIIKKLNGKLFVDELDNSMDYTSMQKVLSVGGKIKTLVGDNSSTVSISTNKWVNKHLFEKDVKNHSNSLEIANVNEWLRMWYPEGFKVFPCRIDQVYLSESVENFREELKKKYELKNFYSKNDPVFIFGMHRKEDYRFAFNHPSHKVIFWCGSDAMKMLPLIHRLKNVTHLAGSKFVSDDLTRNGVKHSFVPVTTASLDLPVCPRGDSIYFYYSENAGDFYGMNFLDEIKSCTGLDVIVAKTDTYSHKELIEIYKKCFIGLRMTPHDGIPTTGCELGLMGRRIVHNGNQPNCLNYKNIKDVIKIIKKEYSHRKEDNSEIADQMRRFLDVGDSWLYV
jgi:glycosyltransferase involved in cell wall biosynthesis